MIRRPTRSTRTDTRFPYTTLFRSQRPGRQYRRLLALAMKVQRHRALAVAVADQPVAGEVEWMVRRPMLRQIGGACDHRRRDRSEERRVGKECVSTCRSRWSPYR